MTPIFCRQSFSILLEVASLKCKSLEVKIWTTIYFRKTLYNRNVLIIFPIKKIFQPLLQIDTNGSMSRRQKLWLSRFFFAIWTIFFAIWFSKCHCETQLAHYFKLLDSRKKTQIVKTPAKIFAPRNGCQDTIPKIIIPSAKITIAIIPNVTYIGSPN